MGTPVDSEVTTISVDILAAILRKRGRGERAELVLFDDGSGHIRMLPETLPLPLDYSGVIVDFETPMGTPVDSKVRTISLEILAAILRKRGLGERAELVLFDDGSGHIRMLPETLPVDYSGVIVDIETPSDLAAWVDAEGFDATE
jgi:hypothetical protein